MLQEFDVNLDLTEIFGLKKSPACSSDLSPIEYIREYKYCWSSKIFLIWWVYNEIEVYKIDWFNFLIIINIVKKIFFVRHL